MRILVFTEGTLLMHSGARGKSRSETVRQVMDSEKSVDDYASYIPVGNCVQKLCVWKGQGAVIEYLTSRTHSQEIEYIRDVLKRYGFPGGKLHFREAGEGYQGVAINVMPDILIEDNCESIGGVDKMTYPHIRPDVKPAITSIVVEEFGGIDHLPDLLTDLEAPKTPPI